jgi:hypothetical protein
MKENLRPGGYTTVRGHGRATARVVGGDEIRIGGLDERVGGAAAWSLRCLQLRHHQGSQ